MDIPVGRVVGGSSSSWSQWMEVDDATFMQLLEEHGQDITTLENQNGEGGRDLGEQRDAGGEVVRSSGVWLRMRA